MNATTKMMTYNIMTEGHPPQQSRLERVLSIIAKEDPAVLAIQETLLCDGPDNWFVHALRKTGDFPYDRALQESDRKGGEWYCSGTAMFSKVQPTSAEAIIKGRAVQMTFQGKWGEIAVASVYLSHLSEKERVPQIREVVSEVKRKQYGIIMGDFNALSPEDGITAKDFETFNPRMKEKYGNGDGTALYYGTMEAALNEGFIDVGLRFRSPVEVTGMTDVVHGLGQHLRPVRIDYVLVSPNLIEHVHGFERINSAETRIASDHFPWTIDIDESFFSAD